LSGKKESPTFLGLVFVEKISGLILLIVGVMLAYYTNIYISDLGGIGFLLIVVGVILAALGLIMFIAKTEQD